MSNLQSDQTIEPFHVLNQQNALLNPDLAEISLT
jgi:hypothetical protein